MTVVLRSRIVRTIAFLAFVVLAMPQSRTASADATGAWQSLSGPPQNGGAMAYDDIQHRVFTFGGDGTSIVRVVSLDGYPYSWTPVPAAGTPPSPRSGCALVFDDAHDRLILFGGTTLGGTVLGDAWTLTLTGTPTWAPLTTLGPAPDPRSDFGACYDPASGRCFVFGGLDADGNVEPNDLYALDLSAVTPTWSTPAQTGLVPAGRYGAPLTVDPDGHRLLLFGGNIDGFTDMNDEFEMDLSTFDWSAPTMSGIVPSQRSDHVCVWDRIDHQLVVWGGTATDDSVRVMGASRAWASLNWFIGPPQRTGPSVGIYDWQWNRLIVLGGNRGADLYTFWRVSPTNFWYGTGPTTAPIAGSFVVDRAHARAIAYGGKDWNNGYVLSDFWQFAFTAPIGWNGVNTGGLPPPARLSHLAVWDERHDRMLVIAGNDGGSATNTVFALSDSADFMNWYPLAPTGTPPTPRTYATGIYDPVGDRVLVYGGIDSANLRGDLRQLSLTPSPAWTTLTPTGGPSGRAGASAIYDEPRHRMILFGGADSVTGNYMNDVWALNLPGATWTHLLPTGTPPIGRWKHTAVYDSRRGRMLVFGGRESYVDSADVWQLNLVPSTPVWTRLAPSGVAPLYRSEASAVYDSIGDRMLVRGGASLIAPNLAIGQEDLWGLQFSGATASVPTTTAPGVSLVGQPWPNPSREASRIDFVLDHAAPVRVAVYDLAGRRVAALASGMQSAGRHELSWNGADDAGHRVLPGLYFYRVELEGRAESRKVVVAR